MTEAFDRAKAILTQFNDLHHAIARRLIQAETVEADEFEAFFVGVPGVPPRATAPAAAPAGRSGAITAPNADRPAGSPAPVPAPV